MTVAPRTVGQVGAVAPLVPAVVHCCTLPFGSRIRKPTAYAVAAAHGPSTIWLFDGFATLSRMRSRAGYRVLHVLRRRVGHLALRRHAAAGIATCRRPFTRTRLFYVRRAPYDRYSDTIRSALPFQMFVVGTVGRPGADHEFRVKQLPRSLFERWRHQQVVCPCRWRVRRTAAPRRS